jgi:hypothetical protein
LVVLVKSKFVKLSESLSWDISVSVTDPKEISEFSAVSGLSDAWWQDLLVA